MTLDTRLLIFSLAGAAAFVLAAVLLRPGMQPRAARACGWLLLIAAVGGSGALALAEFTGRLGPEHFWFRAPSFYVASATLLASTAWWLRRRAPARLRFGVPAALLLLAGALPLLGRLDGRSTPLNLSMPTMGARAPELRYFDRDGRRHRLEDLRGRVVLLNFWATWCTPCRREMPLLSKLQREHARDGLVVLYVSLEEREVLEPFLAQNHFDGVQARLDHAADFYGAGRFYPLSYLVSRDGRVLERWSGRPREEWLQSRIRDLLRAGT